MMERYEALELRGLYSSDYGRQRVGAVLILGQQAASREEAIFGARCVSCAQPWGIRPARCSPLDDLGLARALLHLLPSHGGFHLHG